MVENGAPFSISKEFVRSLELFRARVIAGGVRVSFIVSLLLTKQKGVEVAAAARNYFWDFPLSVLAGVVFVSTRQLYGLCAVSERTKMAHKYRCVK